MAYRRLLRHPLWQRKRRTILARDHWTCQQCGATDRELHVHHRRYTARLPWESPNRDLVTLCHRCHTQQHKKR